MPKTNTNNMVMAWLDMKIHENPDSFDAINAENCLALIRKQRKQLISLGAHFCNLKKQRDKLRKELDDEKITKALGISDCKDASMGTCEPVPWWGDGGFKPTWCETHLDMNKE